MAYRLRHRCARPLRDDRRGRDADLCRTRRDHRAVRPAGKRPRPCHRRHRLDNTASAIALSREACAAGADGVLVVTPYYNKATQRGLVRHFTAVADAVDRPLIVYNVPSRTGVSCTAETYAVLAQHPNIVGVKEATGSFALIQETLNLCGDGFSVWSGNDEDTAAVCALGGAGVISVAANIVPREMHSLVELCLADRILEAGREQLRLAPLIRALFCEVNPIPVKTAMARMGLCSDLLRLPLVRKEQKKTAHGSSPRWTPAA